MSATSSVTRNQLLSRLEKLRNQVLDIHNKAGDDKLAPEQQTRFDRLVSEYKDTKRQLDSHDPEAMLASGIADGSIRIDDPSLGYTEDSIGGIPVNRTSDDAGNGMGGYRGKNVSQLRRRNGLFVSKWGPGVIESPVEVAW